MIVNNRLPPGSSYLESELAEMLGMSRTPVREAVLVLEAQGLLEVRPRRGIRVLPLKPHDMSEIYEILTELEGLAAHNAAVRDLSAEELASLEVSLEDMEAAIGKGDRAAWAEADKRFHDRLVALSGNERLVSLVDSYNDQVHRARILTLHLRPLPEKSNREHRELFEAIRKGDAAAARRIHTRHRAGARKLIVDLLQKLGFHQV